MWKKEISPSGMNILIKDSTSLVPDQNIHPSGAISLSHLILMIDSINLCSVPLVVPYSRAKASFYRPLRALPISQYEWDSIQLNAIWVILYYFEWTNVEYLNLNSHFVEKATDAWTFSARNLVIELSYNNSKIQTRLSLVYV